MLRSSRHLLDDATGEKRLGAGGGARLNGSCGDVDEGRRRNSDESSGRESSGDRSRDSSGERSSTHRHRELIVPDSESDGPFATYVLHTRQNPFDADNTYSSKRPLNINKSLYDHVRQNQVADWSSDAPPSAGNQDTPSSTTSSLGTPLAALEALVGGVPWQRRIDLTNSTVSDGSCRDRDRRSASSGSRGKGGSGPKREDSVMSSASSLASRLSDVMLRMTSQAHGMTSQPHAENVLVNLGFTQTNSFLPRRFVSNWFERVSQAQHEMAVMSHDDPTESSEGSISGRSSPMTAGMESLNRVALLTRDDDATGGGLRRLAHSSTITGSSLRRPPVEKDIQTIKPLEEQIFESDVLDSLRYVINRQARLLQSSDLADGRRLGFTGGRQQSLPVSLDALDVDRDMKLLPSNFHPLPSDSNSRRCRASKTREFFDMEQQAAVGMEAEAETEMMTSFHGKGSDASDLSSSSGPVALSTPLSGSARTSADIESDLEKVGNDGGGGVAGPSTNKNSAIKSSTNGNNRMVPLRRNGTIPTIIINSESLDQQSLTSIEVAEIFDDASRDSDCYSNTNNSGNGYAGGHLSHLTQWPGEEHGGTGDRDSLDNRHWLAVMTGSTDVTDGLLSPFSMASPASPGSVSPITVIEVDKLDNSHDSLDSEVTDPVPQTPEAANDYSVHFPMPFVAPSSEGGPYTSTPGGEGNPYASTPGSGGSPYASTPCSGGGPFLFCRPPSSTVDLYDDEDYLRPVCKHVVSYQIHQPMETNSKDLAGHTHDDNSNHGNSSNLHSKDTGVQQDDGRLSPIRKFMMERLSRDVCIQCCADHVTSGCQATADSRPDYTQTAAASSSSASPAAAEPRGMTRCSSTSCNIHDTLSRCIEEMLEVVIRAIGVAVSEHLEVGAAHYCTLANQMAAYSTSANHISAGNQSTLHSRAHGDVDQPLNTQVKTTLNQVPDQGLTGVSKDVPKTPQTVNNGVKKPRNIFARSVSFDSSLKPDSNERNSRSKATAAACGAEVNKSKQHHTHESSSRRKFMSVDDDEDGSMEMDRRGRKPHHNHHQQQRARKSHQLTRYNSVHNGFGLETIVSVESENSSVSDSDMNMMATRRHISLNSDWSMPVTQSTPRQWSMTTMSKSVGSFDDDEETYSNTTHDLHWPYMTSSESRRAGRARNRTPHYPMVSHRNARRANDYPHYSSVEGHNDVVQGQGRRSSMRAWRTVASASSDKQMRSFDSVQTQPAMSSRRKVKVAGINRIRHKTRAVPDILRKVRAPALAANSDRSKAAAYEAMLEQKLHEDAVEQMSEDESDDYCYYSNRTNDSALSSGGHRSVTSQTEDNIPSDHARRSYYPQSHAAAATRFDKSDYNTHHHQYHGEFQNTDQSGQRRNSLPHSSGYVPYHQPYYGLPYSAYVKKSKAGYHSDPVPGRRKLPKIPASSQTSDTVRKRYNHHTLKPARIVPETVPYVPYAYHHADELSSQQLLMQRNQLLAEIDNVLKYGLKSTNYGGIEAGNYLNSDDAYYYTPTGDCIRNRIQSDEMPSEPSSASLVLPTSYDHSPHHSHRNRPASHSSNKFRHHTLDANSKEINQQMMTKSRYNQHSQKTAADNGMKYNNALRHRKIIPSPGDGKREYQHQTNKTQDKAKNKRSQFWQQVAADRASAAPEVATGPQASPGVFASSGKHSKQDDLLLSRQESTDYKKLEKVSGKDSRGDYRNLIIQEEIPNYDYDNLNRNTIPCEEHNDYDNAPLPRMLLDGGKVAKKLQDDQKMENSGKQMLKDSFDSENDDYLPLMGSKTQQKSANNVTQTTTAKKRALYSTYHSEDVGDLKLQPLNNVHDSSQSTEADYNQLYQPVKPTTEEINNSMERQTSKTMIRIGSVKKRSDSKLASVKSQNSLTNTRRTDSLKRNDSKSTASVRRVDSVKQKNVPSTFAGVKRTDSKSIGKNRLESEHSLSFDGTHHRQLTLGKSQPSDVTKSSDEESDQYLTVLSNGSSTEPDELNYLQVLAESDNEMAAGKTGANHTLTTPTSTTSGAGPPASRYHGNTLAVDSDSDGDTNYLQIIHDDDCDRANTTGTVIISRGRHQPVTNTSSVNSLLSDSRRQFLDVTKLNNESTSSEDSNQNYLRLEPNNSDDELSEKRHKIFDVSSSKTFANAQQQSPPRSWSRSTDKLSLPMTKSASEESTEDYLQILAEPCSDSERRDAIMTRGKAPSLVVTKTSANGACGNGCNTVSMDTTTTASLDSEDSAQDDYLQVLRDSDDDGLGNRRVSISIAGKDYLTATDMKLGGRMMRLGSNTSEDSTQDYLQIMPNSDEEESWKERIKAAAARSKPAQCNGGDAKDEETGGKSSSSRTSATAKHSRSNSVANDSSGSASSSTRDSVSCDSQATERLANSSPRPSKLPRPRRANTTSSSTRPTLTPTEMLVVTSSSLVTSPTANQNEDTKSATNQNKGNSSAANQTTMAKCSSPIISLMDNFNVVSLSVVMPATALTSQNMGRCTPPPSLPSSSSSSLPAPSLSIHHIADDYI